MKIDAYTAGYDYQPHANPLVDLNAKLWMTRARSATLSSVEPPRSELYITDRGWTRLDNRRIGGELNNASELKTGYGAFRLDLGGALQFENIGPQKGVLTTIHDVNANRTLRDASRREFSLNGKLEYRPIERLTLWSGGRYSRFRTEDNGITSTARREERTLRSISVRSPEHGHIGSMRWFPDQHGQYTDATDPRLHNGIVAENSNYPFEGIPFDEISAARVRVSPLEPWTPSLAMIMPGSRLMPHRASPQASASPSRRYPTPWSMPPIPRGCVCPRCSRPAAAPCK